MGGNSMTVLILEHKPISALSQSVVGIIIGVITEVEKRFGVEIMCTVETIKTALRYVEKEFLTFTRKSEHDFISRKSRQILQLLEQKRSGESECNTLFEKLEKQRQNVHFLEFFLMSEQRL